MTNVVQAIQTTLTYSNLAFQLLTSEVNDIARKLDLPESLPVQVSSNFQLALEGKTAGVSGRIETEKFEYKFSDGAIWQILRKDFRRDVDPQSPLLNHLTNEMLVLTKERARAKALEILSQLSFDIKKLEKFYDVKVKDDLMTFHPSRGTSGSFPKELRFYGELISRKKIQIEVVFTRKGTDQSGPNFKFIATTGDLLSLFIWDSPELKRLGIYQKQLPAINVVDLSLPIFFTGEAIDSSSANLEESKIRSLLVREAVAQVQQKLGTKTPKGYLICDNLNAPELVSRELKGSLTNAFFAGASMHWRTNLPFSREQQDAVSKGERGIYIVGFDGNFKTEFRRIEKPPMADYRNKSEEVKTRILRENEQIARKAVQDVFQKMQLSASEQTLFVSLGNFNDSSFGILQNAFSEGAREWGATVVPKYIMSHAGNGSIYWNGEIMTNNFAFLRISGALPYREYRSHGKMIDRVQFEPLLRTPFGSHPLEAITEELGVSTIEIMRRVERVETIRIKRHDSEEGATKRYEGYVLLGVGKTEGNAFAKSLSEAIINEKNGLGFAKMCIFDPGVIFKLWNGKEMVKLTICFTCDDILIERYDVEGKKAHSAFFDFSANRAALVRLCKMAFPKDGAIQMLKEKD
jgi:hypothetical protein